MIEVKNLVKDYGARLAVDHLSFTVEDGQIYGFLGPNGAGKSTTMNIMTGYLGATEGEVRIDGHNILDEPGEAKKRMGYLPEVPPLYLDMTVREYLEFAAKLKKIPKDKREESLQEVMELVKITDVQGRLIKNLSKGYRQRVGMAQAILGKPDVIILDEPTVGLDPKQIIEIRDMIRDLGKKHTVILSSHILSEVSAVCDHIMIISRGKLIASDTPENLEQRLEGSAALELDVKGDADSIRRVLKDIPSVSIGAVSQEEGNPVCRLNLQIGTNAGNASADASMDASMDVREQLFYAFAENRMPILSMSASKASLEEVFLELTEGTLTESQDPGYETNHSEDETNDPGTGSSLDRAMDSPTQEKEDETHESDL